MNEIAMVILIMIVILVSICVWFWASYKVFDSNKISFTMAIIVVMILSALLGVEFLFLIELMIGA